jgi:hypothetical protein
MSPGDQKARKPASGFNDPLPGFVLSSQLCYSIAVGLQARESGDNVCLEGPLGAHWSDGHDNFEERSSLFVHQKDSEALVAEYCAGPRAGESPLRGKSGQNRLHECKIR